MEGIVRRWQDALGQPAFVFISVCVFFFSSDKTQALRGGQVAPLRATCEYCKLSKRYESMAPLSGCGHRFCRPCLVRVLTDAIRERRVDAVQCVVCGLAPSEKELSALLPPVQMDAFREVQLELFLSRDNRFVRCPNEACRCPMETSLAVSGGRDLADGGGVDALGPDGAPLRGLHLEHYNRFRYRCPQCSTAFCSSCLKQPYHAGYTCDEFASFAAARHCRYCGAAIASASATDVCAQPECQEKVGGSCSRRLPCGHGCGGIAGEVVCPPCLHEACDRPDAQIHGADYCSICWVEGLSSAPSIWLECGHAYHKHCVDAKIAGGWPGMRITFGYLDCPLCKKRMRHPSLDAAMVPHLERYEKIRDNALQRLKVDNMENDAKLLDPASAYFNNKEMYALHSFAYYNCFKCKRAFFGGRRDCENLDDRVRDAAEMVCFDCGDLAKVECKRSAQHAEVNLFSLSVLRRLLTPLPVPRVEVSLLLLGRCVVLLGQHPLLRTVPPEGLRDARHACRQAAAVPGPPVLQAQGGSPTQRNGVLAGLWRVQQREQPSDAQGS